MNYRFGTTPTFPSEQDKLRMNTSSSLFGQQLTVNDALLAAALQNALYPTSPGAPGAGSQHGLLMNGSFPSTSLLAHHHPQATGPTNDHHSLQSLLAAQPSLIPSILAAAQGDNPAASSSSHLFDVQRRMELEQMQAILRQVLAFTEANPFTAAAAAIAFGQPVHPSSSNNNNYNNNETGNASTNRAATQNNIIHGGGALQALGSVTRKKTSPYIDASSFSDPHPTDLVRRRTRGGVIEPFPEKLHRVLQLVEEEGDAKVISFFPHGRAFAVHDPEAFVTKVMPKYFKQSRLSSFQRQLNLYGFTRINSGPDTGGYYHELFLKGRSALSVHMRRVGVPKGEDRRKIKVDPKKDHPDFYSMHAVGFTIP